MLTPSRLRAARAIINAKQSDLAKAAGISLATLNNIERGIGDPRTSTLEAIETALAGAGVEISGDNERDVIALHRFARPNAFDAGLAIQQVLELLGPDGLIRADKVLFFARRTRTEDGEEARHRICLLAECGDRAVLFDRVDFSVENNVRAAEIAGIMLAAFAYHRDSLFYLLEPLDDTSELELEAVVLHLRSLDWQEFDHPAAFFDSFDDWDGRVAAFAEREGHPMRDLVALVTSPEST